MIELNIKVYKLHCILNLQIVVFDGQRWTYTPLWRPIQKWYIPAHQAAGHQADRLTSRTGSQQHRRHLSFSVLTGLGLI